MQGNSAQFIIKEEEIKEANYLRRKEDRFKI
jgi:hypothetical protein